MPKPIEYADASPAVRAVYDDIKRTRNVPDVNNFWKFLAHDPATLKRTWESIKEIMAPGALDPLTKEMIYRRGLGHQWLRLLHCQPHGGGAQGGHDGSDVCRSHGGHRHGQRNQPPGQWLPGSRRSGLSGLSAGLAVKMGKSYHPAQ